MSLSKTNSPTRTTILAPLIIGVAAAFAHFAVRQPQMDFIYWQSPLMYYALAGIAIAFACRPALTRIPWSRGVAMVLAVGLLIGIGSGGDWLTARVLQALGVSGFPMNLPPSPLGILAGAVVGGGLMGLYFRPKGGEINGADLWRRLRYHGWGHRLGRMALLALGVVLLWLVIAWVDARMEEGATSLYIPILEPFEPNYWLRLEGLWQRSAAPSGLWGAALLLVVIWLRALLMIAPLVPFALAVRGSRYQLTLVFTILLFVIGEFAPLLRDPSFSSSNWLLIRAAMGLGRSVLVSMALVALFGVIRGETGKQQQEP